jgi:hypothetical protein
MEKQENSQIVETAKEARGAESRSDRPQRAGMEPCSRGGGVCRHLFHIFPDLGFLRTQHANGRLTFSATINVSEISIDETVSKDSSPISKTAHACIARHQGEDQGE